MSECNASSCENVSNRESCCAVEKSLDELCCPIENSMQMWKGAFFQAMKETCVDILKGKIQKTWGSIMEKEADAVIQAMGTHWQSMLAQAKAQADLKETIKKIYQQAGQK